MRVAENEGFISPRGSLFRFGPGFLEDFLRFPIALTLVGLRQGDMRVLPGSLASLSPHYRTVM